jgi:mono/diheme cytochrome c family protein
MNRLSRIRAFTLPLLGALAFAATAPTLAAQAAETANAVAAASADKVARGKYIVSASACHDCHTPWTLGPDGPGPDFSRALSGHPQDIIMPPAPAPAGPWVMTAAGTNTAWAGPWGVSFTANLTPDRETGIGKWSARTFRDTIRNGRHLGRGRQLLPPMPWRVYRNLTDEDLDAVFAYLQTVPPIRNQVPQPLPPPAAAASAATGELP